MGEAVAKIGLTIAIAAAGVLAKKGTEKLWDEVIEPWIDEHGEELWEQLQEALPWVRDLPSIADTGGRSSTVVAVRAELEDGRIAPASARASALGGAMG